MVPSGARSIPRRVPLKLVTGPANAGKAGELLRACRERLDDDPVLVVPRLEDVEHSRRELAGAGAVLGLRVVRFSGLFDLVAERVDPALAAAPRATPLQRGLLVGEAIERAAPVALAASAHRAGFRRAAERFIAELGRTMVEPERLRRALRSWAADGPRAGYAAELASIYAAYREALADAGLLDDELFARRALDALRRSPDAFGRSPVFVYGFDDFTPLELDAIETLDRRAGVEVTVSLPFERGRAAFAATSSAFAVLSELADEHLELPPSTAHYAPPSRAPLAALERRLFEPDPARFAAVDHVGVSPGEAVRLHLAGGERAELELAGTEVLSALRTGVRPGDVALVARDPARYAALIAEVFGSYGVPFSLERSVPLGQTSLGRGIVALLHCAADIGSAADLLAYLRTPGRLRSERLADELDAELRRAAVADAPTARRLWEERRWPLAEIDRLRSAAGGPELLDELDARLERLFAGPYERRAHLLAPTEVEDAAVLRAARTALADVGALQAAGVGPPLEPAALAELLDDLPVRVGAAPGSDRVRVAPPEAIRARRFEVVVVIGLQEGEFPRRGAPEPFLSDESRRELSAVGGLALPVRDGELDRERHLFYACVSRAERRLVLSARLGDEEGAPQSPSFFLEEVRALFAAGSLDDGAARRGLADVTWTREGAPTAAELERALAARAPGGALPAPDGLRTEEIKAAFAARREFSAGELEALAGCGVRWLVEKTLRPEQLAPDAEPLVRGRCAHEALKLTLERLRERTGSARVTEQTLRDAEGALREALEEVADAERLSPRPGRTRAARERLERDLVRHLRREAAAGGRFEPLHLELGFGLAGEDAEGDERPPLELEPEGVRVRGRIDRVDALGERALVRDYKGGSGVFGLARWDDEHRLQLPLYMLAARELLGLDPAGGLYVPLTGKGRPRGAVRDVDAEAAGAVTSSDTYDQAELDAALDAARARVAEAVGRLRAGDVRPCPERCGPGGACRYPAVCRQETA
jgi:ATP-dependent helicase/DNAse subunit B